MKISELSAQSPATVTALKQVVGTPVWTPAQLSPALWFDFNDATLITTSPANSIFTDPGSITAKIGAGVSGVSNLAHILHANPYFGGCRTLCLRGGSSRCRFTGAEALFKNCPGITMAMLFRPTTLTTGTTSPTTQPVYGYIGTGTAAQVRQQIAGDATVSQAYRCGGRQVDGGAASLATVTGNMGNTAAIVVTRTNAATSTRDTWVNGVQRETAVATGQAPGLFSNINSDWVGIGSYNDLGAGGTNDMAPAEYQQVIFDNKAWSDADVQRVIGWMAHGCGLQGILPLDHPYRYYGP